jgi:MFS family permease
MAAIVLFSIQFSIFIVQPILPLFIASLHGRNNSASMVGLVFSVTGLSTMLFVPYWGKSGDKKGHRDVLIKSLLFNRFNLTSEQVLGRFTMILAANITFYYYQSTRLIILKEEYEGSITSNDIHSCTIN